MWLQPVTGAVGVPGGSWWQRYRGGPYSFVSLQNSSSGVQIQEQEDRTWGQVLYQFCLVSLGCSQLAGYGKSSNFYQQAHSPLLGTGVVAGPPPPGPWELYTRGTCR